MHARIDPDFRWKTEDVQVLKWAFTAADINDAIDILASVRKNNLTSKVIGRYIVLHKEWWKL
jgi:hypothetical protein